MRVMSYNILEGGNQRTGDRTQLLLSLLKEHDPDILGLCECGGFEMNGNERLRQFAALLGMTGVMNKAPSGNHVAMLYKEHLEVSGISTNSIGMYNGIVRIVVPTRLGQLAVVMTHLHPFSPTFRLGEAEMVSVRAAFAANSIIMGDMNSLSLRGLPSSFEGFTRTFHMRMKNASGEIDTSPIDMLLSKGWIDLEKQNVRPTYPSRMRTSQEASDQSARLDYILATPDVADHCVRFEVVSSEVAHRASDHLPVFADFEF